jgi:hypothetical protein
MARFQITILKILFTLGVVARNLQLNLIWSSTLGGKLQGNAGVLEESKELQARSVVGG